MCKLYPIIRRQRRPLIVADAPPVVAEPAQPVVAKPLVESAPVSEPEKPKSNDVEVTPQNEPQ